MREICNNLCICDAADAIPYDLHPGNEHVANKWNKKFQQALKDVSQIVKVGEIDEFWEKCKSTTDIRCKKHPKRAKYLIVADLVSVGRVFRHKRDMDMQIKNRIFQQEAEQRAAHHAVIRM